jgi:hypothetical protein
MWQSSNNSEQLANENCLHEEINRRLNSGNACYHSVQSLLSSRLLSRNINVKIYKTINRPLVLYGCETWSVTLREEHRLRVFENSVLRRIFGPKRDEVTGEWRKLRSGELHNLYSSSDIIHNHRHPVAQQPTGPELPHCEVSRSCGRTPWASDHLAARWPNHDPPQVSNHFRSAHRSPLAITPAETPSSEAGD